MADMRDKNSASATVKEKKSLLDEEIGKDFLSSWKSMSVTEDDAMDFGFDTVSNGKKKFDFDKLDMDFNLDGDFDKLSSFKVDMPDLDFSCPSTKNAKAKERAEDDCSSGNHQGKRDFFNFSFDFNDEDFAKDTKTGRKFVGNSKSPFRELPDDEPILLRNEKNINNLCSTGEEFNGGKNESKLDGDLRRQDEQVTEQEPDTLGSQNNIGEDLPASDVQIGSEFVGNSKSITKESTEGEHGLLRNDNNMKNLNDVREDVESDSVQNESKMVGDVSPKDKQVAEGEPFKLRSETSTREGFNTNDDVQINDKLVISKSHSKELTKEEPVSLGSEKNVKCLSNIREVINPDGVQSESKVVNSILQEKEAAIGEPVTLRIKKSLGEAINADGGQNCGKVGNSRPQYTEVKTGESAKLRSEKNSGEVTNDDGVQYFSKIVNIKPQDKQAKTGEPVKLKSEKKSGFHLNPAGLNQSQLKLSIQASGNSKFAVSSTRSIQNLKNVSVEGLKTVKRTSNLSALKDLRTIGGNKDMPNSTVLRQSSSFRNPGQTVKLPGITPSTIAHLVGGIKKQNPVTPSLKRKKIEESNADLVSLKSLKRLSESPKESRKLKETLGGVTEGEVWKHESQGPNEAKNVLHGHTRPRLEVARDFRMTELEISLVMEDDGNVEKAEAYSKELEDICNMLKKKHEEAKEILVRTIVNNNNLLMLNHPIYEEKIRMVQKFATELMCKEIPT
ncbi:uncharacterized protein At4g18490 isoform X2 [Pistacia vera]|uniref:uncharacterized protein At4g18490 isoform X2 n=1 Tax=Pistacia vera TaxID=55513 RepID=UPI001262F91E|nr:uncharacterized protein At4g18490 isoform X2 [Pistacia vera]XP_031275251.1 uncharacterized protein At4g18490 isoform X2 [Pistacia vera]